MKGGGVDKCRALRDFEGSLFNSWCAFRTFFLVPAFKLSKKVFSAETCNRKFAVLTSRL